VRDKTTSTRYSDPGHEGNWEGRRRQSKYDLPELVARGYLIDIFYAGDKL
jgi:hypothetical protein